MKQYRAATTSSLVFDISNDEGSIGTMTYKSWFKFDAWIKTSSGIEYNVEPKGFWGTTIEVKKGDVVKLTIKMNWNGDIVLQDESNAGEEESGYVFRYRGVFRESFVLLDAEGIELAVMKPELRWKKMNYEYVLSSTDDLENHPDKDLLMMLALHCANYYMMMMTSAMI
jgi:hypothetical protein